MVTPPKPHAHQWRGLKTDSRILECIEPGCETVARISDLLEKAEHRGIELGRYQIASDLLQPTAMLTPRGRKALNHYLLRHPLNRRISVIEARQTRLVR